MSEVNIDAQLIEREQTLSRTEEKLVEMSNGCICCTLREDLMVEVVRLAKENRFDYLIIESTGISEPIPVAQTWAFSDPERGIDLSAFSYIDTMVTVVDAYNFFKDFGSNERLADRALHDDEKDTRTIVNLLTDQVEFANVILINKVDLVQPDDLGLLKAAIARLNPDARIISTSFSKVPLKEVINTGLFDYEKAESAAGWIKELNKETHTPETDEYGISSFVFSSSRPFHPLRFWEYLTEWYPSNIIRAKGLFWIASRPDVAINFSQAGGSLRIESAGVWWASMTFSQRIKNNQFVENQKMIESRWTREWGDRMIELVFIGQDLDQPACLAALESCLLTSDEVALYHKKQIWEDPFPDNF